MKKSKRTHALFSLFAILTILLAACGGNSNNANNENNAGDNNGGSYFEPNYDSANDSGNDDADESYNAPSNDSYNSSGSNQGEASGGGVSANAEKENTNSSPSENDGQSPDAHQPKATSVANSQPPEDTFFQDYGVNPFVNTRKDHLSTFALDVDTGSYTVARSYLMDGVLPPIGAIRTEEFINYFPQGYALPTSQETFHILIDGGPTPFTEAEGHQVLRVGIQGFDIDERDRKNVSLTFVVDVSGSMGNGNRMDLVKESLYLLVDQLHADDQVAIIAYTNTAWVELEPTSGSESRKIKSAIRNLRPMGSTNAEAGLMLGYELASRSFMPNAVNRVILASDGVANVGNTGAGSIWESIKFYASEGITLTTVGVGMGNYNDTLLEQLADNGEGFYVYIDTFDEAERVFTEDIVGTLQAIALDAKIQVDFNPDVVASYRLIGFENRAIADEDFTNDRIDAGEIGAGHNATALYEIELHPGARGQIATVYLRWQDPDTFQIHEITQQVFTDELSGSFRMADPYFQTTVLITEFAEILRDSYWAENNSLDDVAEYASRTLRLVEEQEFYELLDLIEEAAWLAGY